MAMGTVAVLPEAARPKDCGYAGQRGGREGDRAVDGGGGGGGLRGEQRAGRADSVQGAGRRPGVERLIERDGAAGHGVAVHVEEAEGDLAGRGGDGEGLAGAGDGLRARRTPGARQRRCRRRTGWCR